jgi:AraC family transcriptional regulator, positive regulator of tynA and feaB
VAVGSVRFFIGHSAAVPSADWRATLLSPVSKGVSGLSDRRVAAASSYTVYLRWDAKSAGRAQLLSWLGAESSMKTIFSTKGVHPRDRFDFWHEVACKNIIDHSSIPQCRQSFEAKIETGMLGNVALILFETSAMDVTRSAKNLSHADDDDLFFCRQLSGSISLEQAGSRAFLNAADLMLLDPLLPYQANFSSHSRMLVLKIPRKVLEARAGNTRDMVAKVISPTDVAHRWTSFFIAMLPDLVGEMPNAAEAIAHEQTLDLIGTSLLTATRSGKQGKSTVRSMALMNVRAAVELLLSNRSVRACCDQSGLYPQWRM